MVGGKVVKMVSPPNSPGKKGGLRSNQNRKTGWKLFEFAG